MKSILSAHLENPPTLKTSGIASATENLAWNRTDDLIFEIHFRTMSNPANEQNRLCILGDLRKCLFCTKEERGGGGAGGEGGNNCERYTLGGLAAPQAPHFLTWIAPNMSPVGHDTCTMIIVHAFTMIIVRVSCLARLMFREVKDGRYGGRSPRESRAVAEGEISKQQIIKHIIKVRLFEVRVISCSNVTI